MYTLLKSHIPCFQPPSLLIRIIWTTWDALYVRPIHCKAKVHWRVEKRVELCRLTWVYLLIGSNIREFITSTVLWYWRFCVIFTDTVSIKSITARCSGVVRVKFLIGARSDMRECFRPVNVPPVHHGTFSNTGKSVIRLYWRCHFVSCMFHLQQLELHVAESMDHELSKCSVWCDLCGMKLNVSKDKSVWTFSCNNCSKCTCFIYG